MTICQVDGCDRAVNSNGMCQPHHYRRTKGLPLSQPIRVRAAKPRWRVNSQGYVERTARKDGKYVREVQHRVVMESVLGRPLQPHETAHHKNGDRADNRPENLELWSVSQPPGQRVEDKIQWAIEFLRQYGYNL